MKTALIFLSLLISSQSITAGSQKTKNITGKVVDSETMQPIAEVTVTLADDSFVLGTLSNENGDFRLWKVPEKCKNLVISYDGYRPQTVSIEHIKETPNGGPLLIKMQVEDLNRKQISLNEKAEKL